MKKLLAIDVETSGLNSESIDPSEDYQIVSIGLVVTEAGKYDPLDELYVEIKWNGESKWDETAQNIHGFSKTYLEKNASDEEKAVEKIALFIDEHFDVSQRISCLGHNVAQFDVIFLKNLFKKYELDFRFSHRHIDTSTLGAVLLNAFTSNDLFQMLGFEARTTHNALEDVKMSLKCVKILTKLWNKYVATE